MESEETGRMLMLRFMIFKLHFKKTNCYSKTSLVTREKHCRYKNGWRCYDVN